MKTQNKYQHFILRLIIIIVLILISDFLIGSMLRKLYFSQTSGYQYRTTYSLEQTNEQLLVFGSSRASHHYVSSVFKDELGVTVYNTGRDGNFILYNLAVLKAVLKRYTPEIIVIDISAGYFAKSQVAYDRLSALLPYYKTHEECRGIIEQKSPYERYKLISSIYPYNSSVLSLIMRNIKRDYNNKDEFNGYLPLYGAFNGSGKQDNKTESTIDGKLVEAFKIFINDAQKAKSKIVVVVSPYYTPMQIDSSIVIAQNICKEADILFLNYSNDSQFVNKQPLFKDNDHLVHNGAIFFSEKVANDINGK